LVVHEADGETGWRHEGVVRDVYSFRPRNYLLGKLENAGRKEIVDVSEYTIEHVMPQNPDLSPEWQEELGADWVTIQEKYLHTLGNLTKSAARDDVSVTLAIRPCTLAGPRICHMPAS